MIKIIIFGCAVRGRLVQYLLDDEPYDVVGFIDNNVQLQGKCISGRPVYAPSRLDSLTYDYIILSAAEYEEPMKRQLAQLGVKPSQIITFMKDEKPVHWLDTRVALLKNCSDILSERKVGGSVAEVGVYQGEFARYINRCFPDRRLYLFDTFSGFVEKDREPVDHSFETRNHFSDTSKELVLSKMIEPDQVIIRDGWFPETVRGIEDTFCFVSLDVDLYQPTMEGLMYFYHRLESGGYIFVHDFDSQNWPGVKKAVYDFCRKVHVSFVPVLDKCGSCIITK